MTRTAPTPGHRRRVPRVSPAPRGRRSAWNPHSRPIEQELIDRLETQSRVRIFTAPSGFCYDLFRPLESIARSVPRLMAKVELVAADLDSARRPRRGAVLSRAQACIAFRFIVGDISLAVDSMRVPRGRDRMTWRLRRLSSWLRGPRPSATCGGWPPIFGRTACSCRIASWRRPTRWAGATSGIERITTRPSCTRGSSTTADSTQALRRSGRATTRSTTCCHASSGSAARERLD